MMMNTATVDAEERESAHTLKYHEESHQVDLIVGFKRDRKGHSTFQVQMSCPCCVGRLFWFSKEQFAKSGCPELEEQASQIEECYTDEGFNIMSGQKTFKQNSSDFFDFSDDEEEKDTCQTRKWHEENTIQMQNQHQQMYTNHIANHMQQYVQGNQPYYNNTSPNIWEGSVFSGLDQATNQDTTNFDSANQQPFALGKRKQSEHQSSEDMQFHMASKRQRRHKDFL